ncbi:MAG TPA: SDR family NAD(P)-dependent oxidoreductase, partial [Acidimicrobiales bacterium]|nr:SDR family NAD(P)-dependent oxidoreductase [Acidimicrobiales bacterium]
MSSRARTVLVTGASRGIGAATARAFAEGGDRVAVNFAVSESSAKAVLGSLPGQGHLLAPGDLSDPSAVRRMVESVAAETGAIDVLVNNAAVYLRHVILEDSYEQWQEAWSRTLAVDLLGVA